jgi:hypothetical protein
MEYLRHRSLTADLADSRRIVAHPLKELEQVTVRATILVDGHSGI